MNDFTFKIDNIEYPVHIVKKRIRNIHYRFKDGAFYISCPYIVGKITILNGLNKYGKTLINRDVKVPPIGNDYIYLYGVKVPLKESGSISFTNGETITYKDKKDLLKKINTKFLKFVTNRTDYYAKLMDLPKYKVSIRNMRTRYGSNSKSTQSIHYSTVLQHYSVEIIDSVIIHELAHILVPNHSKEFYDVVYKYCPNYKAYKRKLNRGEYK